MIGLSLSLCIRDIIEGKVAAREVEKIVAGTCYPDRLRFHDGLRETYCRTYWKRAPDLALRIAMQLWDFGHIEQPRLLDQEHPGVAEGHWR